MEYVEMRGNVYKVSLANEDPNETTFNGRQMIPGEVYIAHSGDKVVLPSHTICFETL